MRLALIAFLAATTIAPASAELPPEKDRWVELRSEQLVFYSSAPEQVPTRLAIRLERLRQVLSRLGGEGGVRTPRPLQTFVFENERAMKPYRMLGPDGKPGDYSAYFLPKSDLDTIALYDFDRGDPFASALTTYLYSLLGASLPDLPYWANLGLASLYSTFTVEGSGADIGRPVAHFVQRLSGNPRIPTARLLAIGRNDPEMLDESRRSMVHAQAWISTHYLVLGRPERRGDFGRYLAALAKGADPTTAFTDSFGLSPQALDEALDVYLRRRSFPFMKYEFAELPPLADFRSRPLPYSEVLARLGDLARRLGPAERARGIELLEAARQRDPGSPLPPFGLALARLDDGLRVEAEALLRDALTRDPGFEPALSALGNLLMHGSGSHESGAALSAEARELLRKATALEPQRLESWNALARAELVGGGDPKAAIRAAETAWRLAPERPDLLGLYVFALAGDGRYSDAVTLLRTRLLASPRAEDRTTGQAYLQQIANSDVLNLANQGKMVEALARIEVYLTGNTDPELAKSLTGYKGQIESQLLGQRCVDLYNEAVRAANAQQFAEARVPLEKLIADCAATDAALVSRAQQLLADLAKFDKKKKG